MYFANMLLCLCVQCLKRSISQGSVAMCFSCGEIFNDGFILNLLLNVAVKKF